MGAPGSVVRKEKTSKGAPDLFFVKDDKYVFVECTTKDKLDGVKTYNTTQDVDTFIKTLSELKKVQF